ncbi:hypothetical protein SAMN05428941_0168 [Streptomyces sp. 2114.2]|nr:hypothetical protein BX268_0164 [Streptomyces sp. 2221.1]SDS26836.1 hypothetical protein SAMN05428941_0168 [Streptomyces sp. 2114.2]
MSTSGWSWVTSPAVAAGRRHRERDALSVDDETVLAARPCAVDRAGTAFGPRRAARTCEESITARSQSSRFFDRSFSGSNVQLVPDTGLVPGRRKASPAGRARAEAELLGQALPLDAGVQDEENPGQGLPVRHPRSALGLLRTRLRQQRLDQRPQFIRHDPRPRLTVSHNQTHGTAGRDSHDQQPLSEPVSAGDQRARSTAAPTPSHAAWARHVRRGTFGSEAVRGARNRVDQPSSVTAACAAARISPEIGRPLVARDRTSAPNSVQRRTRPSWSSRARNWAKSATPSA